MKVSDFLKTDGNLVLLVGTVLSGKSSLIKDIDDENILSSDNIIRDMFPENISYEEAFNESNSYFVTNILRTKMKRLRKSGKSFIVDMMNVTLGDRSNMIEFFNDYKVIAIYFDKMSIEEMKKRNEKRFAETNKNISEEFMIECLNKYTYPSLEEGIDIIYKAEEFV